MNDRITDNPDNDLDDAAERILRDIRASEHDSFDPPVWEPPTRRAADHTRESAPIAATLFDVAPATVFEPGRPVGSTHFEPSRPGVERDPFAPVDRLDAASDIDEETPPVTPPGRTRESYTAKRGEAEASPSRWLRVALIALAALIALGGIAVAGDFVAYRDKVHPGVSVQGIEVGGLTAEEAREAVLTGVSEATEPTVTVKAADSVWETSAADLGMSFDATRMAESAFSVGRDASFFGNVAQRVKAWVNGVEFPATLTLEPLAEDELFETIASEVTTEPVQSAVDIDGTEFSVIPGSDGTDIDREALRADLKAALLSSERTVEADIVPDPMNITPDIAQKGIAVAERMVADPSTLRFEGDSWVVEPKTIASWITFGETETPDGWRLDPAIDDSVAGGAVKRIVGSRIGSTAKNASFYVENGQVKIRPSEKGQGVDVNALVAEMNTGLTAETPVREYTLVVGEVDPDITTADAEAMGIKDKLSTYTTSYTAGAINRNTNIRLMADVMSGSLVPPGGTWGFHEVGGPTTIARGFKPAGAIMNGIVVDELGGGICQVATTMFNAVYEAGFPVLERSPHSRYMSNYPDGRDAAVSWTIPDLKWQNPTDHWVLVTTSHTGTTVTFTIWGTETGWKVSSSNSGWTTLGGGGTREIKKADMDEGTKRVIQSAQNGRTITVYRTVTKDGEVIRKDSFKSVYRPVDKIVEVGTRKVEPKPEPKPKPEPDPVAPAPTPPTTDTTDTP